MVCNHPVPEAKGGLGGLACITQLFGKISQQDLFAKVVLITILMIYGIGGIVEEWGENTALELVQDLSESCVDDVQLNFFLPYGMGVADAMVILMSSKNTTPNCVISFNRLETTRELFVLLTIEFSYSREIQSNACEQPNTSIIILEESHANTEVCDYIIEDHNEVKIYSSIRTSSNVSVQIKSSKVLPTIKLTATAARRQIRDIRCSEENEITCQIGNMTLCISIELLCDQNINCGRIGKYDEDKRICEKKRYYKLWAVVTCSLLMLLIVAAFLINLFRMYLPPIPDNFFIFNEDEDNKLILASKYIAPQKSISQERIHELELQSFKYRSVSPVPNLPSTSQEEQKPRASFSPEEPKMVTIDTIDIELLKRELRQEIEREMNRAIMAEYRPRFESDFIRIMDHIDPPNTPNEDLPNEE